MGTLVVLSLFTLGLALAGDTYRYDIGEEPISFCQSIKDEPLEVILKGDAETSLVVGQEYVDAGFENSDGCESYNVEVDGTVNTGVAGDYTLSYNGTTESGKTGTSTRLVHVISPRGTIYLTFDDGASPYTYELLDVLAKYGVKATFFVTCAGDDDAILREYNEGHSVALHTCTHGYSYIYSSVDNFFEDLYRVQERVKNITGYTSYLMRFPGGSSNLVSTMYDGGSHIMSTLVNAVEARGFTYFDWNISSGDAGGATTADEVFENVVYSLKDGGSSVVLQHDTKAFSVAAVERIIVFGLNNGYSFGKLDANSFTAHHGVNN